MSIFNLPTWLRKKPIIPSSSLEGLHYDNYKLKTKELNYIIKEYNSVEEFKNLLGRYILKYKALENIDDKAGDAAGWHLSLRVAEGNLRMRGMMNDNAKRNISNLNAHFDNDMSEVWLKLRDYNKIIKEYRQEAEFILTMMKKMDNAIGKIPDGLSDDICSTIDAKLSVVIPRIEKNMEYIKENSKIRN